MPSPMLGRSAPDRAVGQVEWRFKCVWGASGEEDADPTLPPGSPPRPWWNPHPPPSPNYAHLSYPRHSPLDAAPHTPRSRVVDKDSDPDKSNARYRTVRRQHPNAQFGLGTGARLGDRYWSVLPEHVRGQLGPESGWDQGFGYEGVPSGWWCERCGRVNFQALLRMRWCVSAQCRVCFFPYVLDDRCLVLIGICVGQAQAKEVAQTPVRGFAIPLEVLRDPMSVMPTTHPYDTYPAAGCARASVSVWADGMRTFSYVVHEAANGGINPGANCDGTDGGSNMNATVSVKHVFAGNAQRLQAGATQLLLDMQREVPLRRAIGPSGGHFSHSGLLRLLIVIRQAHTLHTLFPLVIVLGRAP